MSLNNRLSIKSSLVTFNFYYITKVSFQVKCLIKFVLFWTQFASRLLLEKCYILKMAFSVLASYYVSLQNQPYKSQYSVHNV